MKEVAGGWRGLHNWEFHKLYTHNSRRIMRVIKSRRMRLAGNVACIREIRDAYKILVRKPEGKRPLGRPRSR